MANSVGQYAAVLADILVAHTDSNSHAQVVRALQEAGFKVRECSGTRETFDAFDAAIPDLLVVGLSGPEGLNLIRTLHGHPIRASVAVLALDPTGEPAALLEAGADDVLGLPLNAHAVRLRVQSLLRLKFAERSARELLARRSRDQQSLQRASQRVAASTGLDEVLTVTAEVLRANLGFDRVGIALFDQEQPVLRYVVSTDTLGRIYTPAHSPVTITLAPGSAMLELPAFQSLFVDGQDSYYIPDTGGRAPGYFRPFLDGPVGEALLVALRAGADNVGLLTVDNALSGRSFGPEDAGLLLTFGRQVALAIARARLADELLGRAKEAEQLAAVGIAISTVLDPNDLYPLVLAQAAALFPVDYGAVLLYRDGWAKVAASYGSPSVQADAKLWSVHEPAKPWLPTTRGVSYVRDTDKEATWFDQEPWLDSKRMRSVLSIPMTADSEIIGAVLMASSSPDMYQRGHLALAAAFGERIDQALRNARLYVAEQQRARASEELAQLRTTFVESVSHELRTPLTAILGYTEILQSNWDSSTDESRKEWIGKIAAAAGRQQRLVDDLLLLTRMEGGVMSPRIERVPLRYLAQRAAEEVQGSYRGQRIDLVGSEQIAVLADPGRALQIVANLMDNAAKYSPEGSPIIVWWGPEDECGTLRVLDRGPGVPVNGRDHLFKRFGRVPGSRIRAGRVGTGLGLYMGRGLASAMGGELDLESTGPEGSTFRLRLPLARD